MSRPRRIFVSGPRERYLDRGSEALRSAILQAITDLGYECTAFGTPEGGSGWAEGITWNATEAIEAMRRCVGAVLLGFPYWRAYAGGRETGLVTEYCHYEGALAAMLDLPVLALLEAGTAERGAFDSRAGNAVLEVPCGADAGWVETRDFRDFLAGWHRRVAKRRDVFLACSSGAGAVADRVLAHLEQGGTKVLDWRRDFADGDSILAQIEDAAKRCSAAVVLFTADDRTDRGATMPRDNVVLEAGYFIHAKGKRNVLIVREAGAKMPADLGGEIYVEFVRDDLTSALKRVDRFVVDRVHAGG